MKCMKRKHIIFGAGNIGERFLYNIWQKVDVDCFWDNYQAGELLGYTIEKPRYEKGVFIIVAVEKYLQVRTQLLALGYLEFDDFVPYQIFHKKMAVAYGNCHMDAVKKYLVCSKTFSAEYGFYPFPRVQDMDEKFEYENILKHADLFLHQAIRLDNCYGEKYASEYMLQYVPQSCKILAIPNLYGLPKVFFPQLDMIYRTAKGRKSYFFLDANIVNWLNEGKTVEEIVLLIAEGKTYSKQYILSMWQEFQRKLLVREQEWDIKISDYIFENYQKIKLFCDTNHISSLCAREIASRILMYLGYSTGIASVLKIMDDMECFVYPDVKDALGLKFEEHIIREYSNDAFCSGGEMDLKNYVEQICSYTLLNFRCEGK